MLKLGCCAALCCRRWGVADPTTLVVVGAAAVLGAACRAPLTAFGLMVEITRCVQSCLLLLNLNMGHTLVGFS
jgi:H+/Cl- antiporter ClcA